MLARIDEQEAIETTLKRLLTDLSKTNAVRVKAALRILMTTDQTTFENICSLSTQEELKDFVALLKHPETIAPKTASTPSGLEAVVKFIKDYTLTHLFFIDYRTSILPNTYMVTKSLLEGERLKSVIYASALRNVVSATHFVDSIEKHFRNEGLSGPALNEAIKRATEATANLHNFVIEGNIIAVERELKVPGIDVNHPNPEGLPLLHLATREGHTDIVALLLNVPGIKINMGSNSGWTALQLAARLGELQIVELLVHNKDCNVNIANSDGWTALHWAAWHGHTEIVIVLLEVPNIQINPRDKTKTTPLHWAARNGNGDIVSVFLAHKETEVNPQDNEQRTPLHYAVQYDHSSATAAFLLSPNIDVNIQDMDGLTPLHWAARNGRLDTVTLLLDVPNIKTNIRDHSGYIAQDWAKMYEYKEIIPLLEPEYRTISFFKRLQNYVVSLFEYIKGRLSTT